MQRFFGLVLSVLLCCLVAGVAGSVHHDGLLFHMETMQGEEICSQRADELFNPASVVKVGTTLWALDRLGPEYRYETRVGYQGSWDRDSGTITGVLVVRGSDPDFHTENAILIARELNRLGVRRVKGGIAVSARFTVGWEHGVARRESDVRRRGQEMGRRLLESLDPRRWDSTRRACWDGLCERRGWQPDEVPAVVVDGPVQVQGDAACTPLLRHSSNPLPVLLKRFNVYSNNDIIRIADGLGGAPALEAFLRQRLGATAAELQVGTASGEERNRMSARGAVRLVRAMQLAAARQDLGLHDLFPVPGCDPGPVPRMFPMLASGERARTVVCKTGTLRTQDAGVAVLAGSFVRADGQQVLFCVAAPGAGRRLQQWRRLQQRWLLAQLERLGTAPPAACPGELAFSDTGATVVAVEQHDQESPQDEGVPARVVARDG